MDAVLAPDTERIEDTQEALTIFRRRSWVVQVSRSARR